VNPRRRRHNKRARRAVRLGVPGCPVRAFDPCLMTARVSFFFDDSIDVLTASLTSARVVRARPSETDGQLILRLDPSGRVVGLQLIGASKIRPALWEKHPERARLPPTLLSEVDAWLAELWSLDRNFSVFVDGKNVDMPEVLKPAKYRPNLRDT
jgi:hypothetical protein